MWFCAHAAADTVSEACREEVYQTNISFTAAVCGFVPIAAADTVSEACREEVYQFYVMRNTTINKNVPLGACVHQEVTEVTDKAISQKLWLLGCVRVYWRAIALFYVLSPEF